MTVRFTDKDKFRDKWYRNLTPKEKCMWEYFVSECNHAGILEFDLPMMSVFIGDTITQSDLDKFIQEGKVIQIDKDRLFIPKFVLFQQRIQDLSELNPKNRCHKSIIEQLRRFNISPFEDANKPLVRAYSNSNSNSNSKSKSNSNSKDIYCNKDFEKCFKIYSEICPKLIPLRFERRSKTILEQLRDFLTEIDYDFDYFTRVCIKANKLERIVDTKIDFKMLIKNHAGIMSDKYSSGKSVTDYQY